MQLLYPSWIEIPVNDIQRAQAFYCAVFGLTNTDHYQEEPATQIIVLLPSDKSVRGPGVSLVQSPQHRPCRGGVQINFHVGAHAALDAAMDAALAHGGELAASMVVMDDGVRYATLYDSEGNPIAISSYEPVEPEE
jgi:predicted enzyme related to lactoylglutathione lyase